ncbi:tetratricopeptide repeat protein [Azotobacter beijerinckii]|jgi:tetratricopeptide (TPR) repeat protein|uniref:tetratricopeptide repeat protein n=1 Tax=Azotobacter beijerinckii TaxID=170623 RepID=UPI000B8311EB
MCVKSKLALGLIAASVLVGNIALAAPGTKDLVKAIHEHGWFKACPRIMVDISAMKEPADRASEEWRDFVLLRAGCLAEVRRDVEAIAFLKAKLESSGRRDPNLLNFLGISQLRVGKNADAIVSFEEALESGMHEGTKKGVYSKLAAAYSKLASDGGQVVDQNRVTKAEMYAQMAVDRNASRSDPTLVAQLATIKIMKKDYDEAIRLFDQALQMNVSYPHWQSAEMRKVMEAEFTMGKGQTYYNKGDKAQGEALMNEAIEIAPTETLKTVMRAIRDTTITPTSIDKMPEVLSVPYVPLDEDV